jgi:long-chain acyl-CoA synthetase
MNETADAGRPMTIPACLDYAAERFAERLAYIEGDERVSWSNMRVTADEVAAGLIERGLQEGDRVAICAENSIDWLIAYHAVARAGGAGVLVYHELQPAEIERQVAWPESRFLFASAGVHARLPGPIKGIEETFVLGTPPGSGDRFSEVADWATLRSREELAARSPSPDDLAAIVYTSGTTGGAKGVMLSHRNFMSNGHSALAALDVSASDSVLLVLPLHHAMPFLATVVLPALVGAHFIIENDLRRIRDRLQEQRPTIFFGVPALFELMYRNVLARAESEGRLKTLLKLQSVVRGVKRATGLNLGPLVFRRIHKALGGRLRFLVSGGAALKPQTALDFFSLGLPLLQGWGMTEASPAIAVQRFSPGRFRFTRHYERLAGSVGQAIDGVEVQLVDVPEKDIRVAESGEGEVLARGENVFMGYWQAEDATAAARQDGWLRTGDLGRIDKDGNIFLTGRSKYIIVLDSGEKVHPDELEENLSESDLIEDVCIVGRQARDKVQVTAVIYPSVEAFQAMASDEESNTEAALRRSVHSEVERLGRQLAAYKRVSAIELSDEPLPKTALQKVARGRIADTYTFDFERWLASSKEHD